MISLFNEVQTRRTRIKILFSILMISLFLTACAGQQSARHLAGLEIATMIDYKKEVNNKIAAEERYYQEAFIRLNKNLEKMQIEVISENILNARALRYTHLWEKNFPTEYDKFLLIDTVYTDFVTGNERFEQQKNEIAEQYFSKIEKLNAQLSQLEESIGALKKLYASNKFHEMQLMGDYGLGIIKILRSMDDTTKNQELSTGVINGQ